MFNFKKLLASFCTCELVWYKKFGCSIILPSWGSQAAGFSFSNKSMVAPHWGFNLLWTDG
jgi:hypothetical protein